MRRLLLLALSVLLLVPTIAPAHAARPDAYYCLHPDIAVSAGGQLSVSLTNGTGSAAANVMVYAGAPGFVLPDNKCERSSGRGPG